MQVRCDDDGLMSTVVTTLTLCHDAVPKASVHCSNRASWLWFTLGLMASRAAWKSLACIGRILSAETVATAGPSSLQCQSQVTTRGWLAAAQREQGGQASVRSSLVLTREQHS